MERKEKKIYDDSVSSQAAIDALRDMIKQIGSLTYGKERFFEQERGIWYDRKYGDYISITQVIERVVEAVKLNEE